VKVTGVEASPAMARALRAKRGGSGVTVVMGDFADPDVCGAAGGPFHLVYVVDDTFHCLPDQEAQVRCIATVASRLEPRGALVVACSVPDPDWWGREQGVEAADLGDGRLALEAYWHDRSEQVLRSQVVSFGAAPAGPELRPIVLRYAWPSELDLMARLAGLRLRHRWGGWRREPFDRSSRRHVSVYERGSSGRRRM
jgi:SAM-dependent methyltransferase